MRRRQTCAHLLPRCSRRAFAVSLFLGLRLLLGLCRPDPVAAQGTQAAGAWAESISGGLALTTGNKDTFTVNAGYDITYDPKTGNIVKSTGLLLRGRTDGELTADRLDLNGRDEFRIVERGFLYGQLEYLRDQFKNIDYLFSPTVGAGYRLADTPVTSLLVDAGLGVVWEKSPLSDVSATGGVSLDEKLSHRVSPSATLTQTATALYKTSDFGDALYTFTASLAAAVTTRTQVKVEVLDTYKNQVEPDIRKNDLAVIVGVVFKR